MAVIKILLKILLYFLSLFFILVICTVGLAIWSFPKLAPKAIDSWVEQKTGFSTTIKDIDLKIFSGILSVDSFILINPSYYQNKNFIQIKQISIQVKPRSIYTDKIIFDYIFIDIDKLTCVRNASGSINIVEFLNRLKEKKSPLVIENDITIDGVDREFDASDYKYLIKKLIIRIKEVDTVGFPEENDLQNFVLNYDKEFTDVTDIESVMNQFIEEFKLNGALDLVQGLFLNSTVKEIFGKKKC